MKYKNYLLFLLTAFSRTQIHVVGYIGISEIFTFCIGPYVLIKQWNNLRRDGFAPVLVLDGLWIISALVTDVYRETQVDAMLKGIASPLSIMMAVPCVYALLKDDVRSLKWAILGFTVTMFLSTFFVQTGGSVDVAERMGISAREAALEYKLTLMGLVNSVVSLVPQLGYLQFPMLSVLLTLGMAVFALLQGGRSSFLCLIISAGFLFWVRGHPKRSERISKALPIAAVLLLMLVVLAKEGYELAAKKGYMNEEEQKKYEMQSENRIGLLSARPHFVSVFFAVCDSPFLGHGSWAIDWNEYGLRAALWLEDEQAIASYRGGRIKWLTGHSHIMTAYVWHGLLGAVFWLYVFRLMWRTVRYHLGVVPELYGFFALMLPVHLWGLVFSPFGSRVLMVTIIVSCLLVARYKKIAKSQVYGFVPGN